MLGNCIENVRKNVPLVHNITNYVTVNDVANILLACGGNVLGGGKFSLMGSVIGAYTIQALTTTLYAMNVKADQLPVYKAIVVVIIVTLQSPVFQSFIAKQRAKKAAAAVEGGK